MLSAEKLQTYKDVANNLPQKLVRCRGAYDLSSQPINELEVLLSYEDLVFILAMLEDYMEQLKELDDPNLDYYIVKYKCMADRIRKINVDLSPVRTSIKHNGHTLVEH